MHPSRGTIVDHGDGLRTITLHSGLTRVQRNDVLTHELVHDEFGEVWPLDCPGAVRSKSEARVTRISDERQLPPAELLHFVRQRDDEMVLAWQVADEFDVAIEVADRSLRRLAAGF